MPQRFPGFPLLPACLALSLAACASAPPAAGPPAKAPVPKSPGLRSINLLCHEGARAVFFDKVGVPAGERPIDVAITPGATWVLFDSGRVLQFQRGGVRRVAADGTGYAALTDRFLILGEIASAPDLL
jgi:hypothetical protein